MFVESPTSGTAFFAHASDQLTDEFELFDALLEHRVQMLV